MGQYRAELTKLGLLLMAWLLSACSSPHTIDLVERPADAYFVDPLASFPSPPPKAYFKPQLELREEFKGKPSARVWLRYDLPPDTSYAYAFKCSNIQKVFAGDRLLYADKENKTYPSISRIFSNQPVFRLPSTTFYVQTFYSSKADFGLNCRSFQVGPWSPILRQLLLLDLPSLISGTFILFIGSAGLLLTVTSFGLPLLYFSAFSLAVGALFITGTSVGDIIFGSYSFWKPVWHFSTYFALIPFFLFFDSLIKTPKRSARRIALLHMAIFTIFALSFLIDDNLDLAVVRTYFLWFFLLELTLFLPVITHAIILKRPYARAYGSAMLIFIFSAIIDVYSNLAHLQYFSTSPWVTLGLVIFAMVSLIRMKVRDGAKFERDKATWVQERNKKLRAEVEKRIEALGTKSLELEMAHIELEERLELLMGQKRRMSELAQEQDNLLHQIAGIHQRMLPNLIKNLQRLHQNSDASQLPKIAEEISSIGRVLDPLARLYKERKNSKHHRIDALCSSKKHQRTLKIALGSSRLDLQIAEGMDNFFSLLSEHPSDIMVIEEWAHSMIREFHEKNPKATIVLLTESGPDEAYEYLANNSMLDQAFSLQLPKDILHKMLMTHFSKFMNQDIFGIEKYLMWGSVVKERPLLARGSQESAISGLRKDIEQLDLPADQLLKVIEICEALMQVNRDELICKPNAQEQTIRQLRFGYDANLTTISIDLIGHLQSRQQIIQEFKSMGNPALKQLLSTTHALILNSDGRSRHELIAICYTGNTDFGKAFFYPFIVA